MQALNTLFPVFFMLGLGFLTKVKGWLTNEQKAGANTLVFSILFPILVFSLLASAQLQLETIGIILYVTVAFALAIFLGQKLHMFTGKDKSHFSHFLLTSVEGGAVALPLYLSIVGKSSNTVIYDLAGAIIAFLVVPILVAKKTNNGQSKSQLVKDILGHPFVIAIILGLVVNLTGIYSWIMQSTFADLYQATLATVTGPILGIILFVLGFDFSINFKTLGSMMSLIVVRILFYLFVITGFFLLFPQLMAEKSYMIGVLIYFMSPTGFAMPLLIENLYKTDDDRHYAATYISLFMLVTLFVYTIVVIFIA
ncbi:transporter [Streptococcus penaeicida]|uniref:Transporter n=1 Tax=Streptococcus penaeicida TaxID=1765960 RepID=A0A2N8LBS5_9STRE|nr:AEC family transporter [Streptococcus penaeicida]PND47621.1 transporter [Streptococcus penaeicida]